MNITIDAGLIARLAAIKLAYESGALTSVPYIEPHMDDFSRFSQTIAVKKEEDSQQGSGGGGGTLQGLRQNSRPKTSIRRR